MCLLWLTTVHTWPEVVAGRPLKFAHQNTSSCLTASVCWVDRNVHAQNEKSAWKIKVCTTDMVVCFLFLHVCYMFSQACCGRTFKSDFCACFWLLKENSYVSWVNMGPWIHQTSRAFILWRAESCDPKITISSLQNFTVFWPKIVSCLYWSSEKFCVDLAKLSQHGSSLTSPPV